MDDVQDFFVCDECENKDFELIYNFSLNFHGVNFSEDLIYDKIVEETYQCIKCKKKFTKKQIEDGLAKFKEMRRKVS
ncbi:MAG: hypothetical protein J7L16_01880 [Deltaproteobacteria bacterium]|nr:hypothetical protein [Deltaproteobacteria bacterium]